MSFAWKTYDELKTAFNEVAVKIALQKKHKDLVESLPDHPRIPIQFIQAVFNYIDNSPNSKLAKIKHYVAYGAMHLVTQVADGREFKTSLTAEVMGIKNNNQPDSVDYVMMLNLANQVFPAVFGVSEHVKNKNKTISEDKLISYLSAGSTLEAAEFIKLVNAGKSPDVTKGEDLVQEIPAGSLSNYPTWPELQRQLTQIKVDELTDKGTGSVDRLPIKRAQPLRMIETLSKLLEATYPEGNNVTHDKKRRVLIGALYAMRACINFEYGKPLEYDGVNLGIAKASLLHEKISELIKPKEHNHFQTHRILRMFERFICDAVMDKSQHTLLQKHPFSELGDYVKTLLIKSHELSARLQILTLEQGLKPAKKAKDDAVSSASASSGVMSGMSSLLGKVGLMSNKPASAAAPEPQMPVEYKDVTAEHQGKGDFPRLSKIVREQASASSPSMRR